MKEKIKVFISNAQEDFETAKRLYDDLKNAGLFPWLEEEDLLPGSNRDFKIREAIKTSRYFLALLSSHSVTERGIVQKKLKSALDVLKEFPEDDIFIIPVRVEDCIPPLNLSGIHSADLFPSYHAGLRKILKTIGTERIEKETDDEKPNKEDVKASVSPIAKIESQTCDLNYTQEKTDDEIPRKAKWFAGIFFTTVTLAFLLTISKLSLFNIHDLPTNMQLVNINTIVISSV